MKAEIKNNQRTSKDFCLKGEIGKKNQFYKKIQKKKVRIKLEKNNTSQIVIEV